MSIRFQLRLASCCLSPINCVATRKFICLQQSCKLPFWHKHFALSDRICAVEEEGDVFGIFAFRHAEINEGVERRKFERDSECGLVGLFQRPKFAQSGLILCRARARGSSRGRSCLCRRRQRLKFG